jgi:hypothetical protein
MALCFVYCNFTNGGDEKKNKFENVYFVIQKMYFAFLLFHFAKCVSWFVSPMGFHTQNVFMALCFLYLNSQTVVMKKKTSLRMCMLKYRRCISLFCFFILQNAWANLCPLWASVVRCPEQLLEGQVCCPGAESQLLVLQVQPSFTICPIVQVGIWLLQWARVGYLAGFLYSWAVSWVCPRDGFLGRS